MVVTASGSSILPLKITGATVRKRATTILHAVDLSFDEHGFTLIMGPNGSGKTTLLRLAHGLERPFDGHVQWNKEPKVARSRQAFVFQTPVMMRRSVIENIAYPLIVRGVAKTNTEKRATIWAQNVGLGDSLKTNALHLSGGERQKLAIARALICKPDVVFLDEPTTNLDGRSTKEIEAILLSAYKDNTRIVMTTHDIGQAKRLATDVVFLNKGHVLETTQSRTFFTTPLSTEAKAYLQGDLLE